MNIYSKLLLGAAALAFAACSSEEPVVGNESTAPGKPSGDVAYLTVRINPSGSRADGSITDEDGTKQQYIYGDEDENRVKNAYFFFYDDKGQYVLQSNSWVDPATGGTTPNVELKGQNTVILTGLTGKNYPSWVITVLNCPEQIAANPGQTIEEMGDKILDSYMNADGDFIMSTSSHFCQENRKNPNSTTAGWYYYATRLNEKNFLEETPTKEESTESTVVNIYVERLAARVGVDITGLTNPLYNGAKYEHSNGEKYNLYQLDISVSGEENPDLEGTSTGTAATKVYIAIIGWRLNSTARRTNLMKDLDGWNNNSGFGSWTFNSSTNHRSFWGKSYTYGYQGESLGARLRHGEYAWDQLTNVVGDKVFNGTRDYCNETTNLPENIVVNGAVSPKYTPSVLLSAVVCGADGKALQLVSYRGVEFLKDSFIKKALSTISKTDLTKNYYTRKQVATAADEVTPIYEYTQVGFDDVKLVSSTSQGIGAVKLAVADETTEFYQITGAITQTDATGKEYTTYDAKPVSVAEVNSYLATATDGASNKAVAKTDGAMYYSIPLEHLNNNNTTNEDGDEDSIIEGQYGVVRNHIYNLSITKIKTLGDGVFKPTQVGDEGPEKLDPVDPKDPTFYVESAINILSWKIVSQQVEI